MAAHAPARGIQCPVRREVFAQGAVKPFAATAFQTARRFVARSGFVQSQIHFGETDQAFGHRQGRHGGARELRHFLEFPAGQILQRTAAAIVVGVFRAHVTFGEKLIHGFGRAATGGNSLDDRRRPGDTVATREDFFLGSLHRLAVDFDVAPFVELHRQIVVEKLGVGALTDGADDGVGREREITAFHRHRAAATGTIWFAQGHLQTVQFLAAFTGGDLGGRGEENHFHAFMQSFFDFIFSAGISSRVRR